MDAKKYADETWPSPYEYVNVSYEKVYTPDRSSRLRVQIQIDRPQEILVKILQPRLSEPPKFHWDVKLCQMDVEYHPLAQFIIHALFYKHQ